MQTIALPETRKLEEIVWRKDLYPRFEPNPAVIDQYISSLDALPPIEINQHNELIDGYHRWTAHKSAKAETIKVVVTQTASEVEFMELAVKRNTTHGLQMSLDEKKHFATMMYGSGPYKVGKESKAALSQLFAVGERTMDRWCERKDKELKEHRDKKIAELWLACYTEQEIAERVGLTQQAVSQIIEKPQEIDSWQKLVVLSEYKEPDFTPPLYDVWKLKEKTNSSDHFGNSEASFTDNLLYMYTKPFDIVVDPFGGGGATIDICKKRLRRYWVSDRIPNVKRPELRIADIAEGAPTLHKRWNDVALVFLDPPYWRQAQEQYSKDPQDLANMQLPEFYNALSTFIGACSEKMRSGSHIALMIQPTQWKADDRRTVDHVIDLILECETAEKLRYLRRISCPYESQQYNAQQVNWAKENREILMTTREIIIWEIA